LFSQFKKRFGENVRKRRQKLRISQEKLAEMAESHRNYIGAVERGECNITLLKALLIAKALRCRLSDLLQGAEPDPGKRLGGTE
jgi:transcriptional regulator with XRE-family HTH domain